MRKPLKFGKYLLLDRIAVGGMAEVFVAKAFGVEGFERLLAIKKILPTMGEDPEFISMFVDEARIAVQLSHANIVQILELGKHDENLYIAMEYIAGRDLRQVLERFRKKGRPMPVAQACLVIAKVCEALDYAHRKRDGRGQHLGIVHRDVSPQNVIVSYDGDVKLIDFGIAKAESRLQKTQAGILKGKFSYMSPEQVRGQPIDHRSDVFAVGVCLWELLTGEKLFTGESDFAVLEKVRQGLVPPPRQLNHQVSEALQTVVMKALKPEVADRYQWASELHDDLMRFCVMGDMVYGTRQLAEWVREEFETECGREQEKLRGWMGAAEEPPEITPTAKTVPEIAEAKEKPAEPVKTPVEPFRVPSFEKFRLPVDRDTIVPAPTPAQGSPAVARTMPERDLAALFRPGVLEKTPAAAVPLDELPTMKMDGDVLAAAERALFAREHATPNRLEERTDPGPPKALSEPSLRVTVPEGVFASMVASVEPAAEAQRPRPTSRAVEAVPGGNGSPEGRLVREPFRPAEPPVMTPLPRPVAAPPPPPPSSNPEPTRPTAQVPTVAPVPLSFFDEPTQSLPVQPTKPEEKAAAARKDQVKKDATEARRLPRVAYAALLLGLVGVTALWLALSGEKHQSSGMLVVTVRPLVPAQLYIDGQPVGSTPYVGRGIPVGPHQLEVKAQGFRPYAKSVVIEGSPRPLEVQVELAADPQPMLVMPEVVVKPARPEPPPPRSQPAPEAAAPPEAPATEPPPEAPASEPEAVEAPLLRITTEPPGAAVTVDGRPQGKSPVIVGGLDPSHYHAVAAALDGYATARRAAKMEATGTTVMHLPLQPRKPAAAPEPPKPAPEPARPAGDGFLAVATSPVTRVLVDGQDTGRWTPVPPSKPLTLPPGPHRLTFETSSGKRFDETIVIEPGKTKTVIRNLR